MTPSRSWKRRVLLLVAVLSIGLLVVAGSPDRADDVVSATLPATSSTMLESTTTFPTTTTPTATTVPPIEALIPLSVAALADEVAELMPETGPAFIHYLGLALRVKILSDFSNYAYNFPLPGFE